MKSTLRVGEITFGDEIRFADEIHAPLSRWAWVRIGERWAWVRIGERWGFLHFSVDKMLLWWYTIVNKRENLLRTTKKGDDFS